MGKGKRRVANAKCVFANNGDNHDLACDGFVPFHGMLYICLPLPFVPGNVSRCGRLTVTAIVGIVVTVNPTKPYPINNNRLPWPFVLVCNCCNLVASTEND